MYAVSEWTGARVTDRHTRAHQDFASLADAMHDLKVRGYGARRFSESFDVLRVCYEVSWGDGDPHPSDASYLVTPLPSRA